MLIDLPFWKGFGVGGGLIVAIGAQNAFVLAQGVRRQHHLMVALVCVLCDALLIVAGVTSVGAALARFPSLVQVATWAGVLFLAAYGLRAFVAAYKGEHLSAAAGGHTSFRAVLLVTLAVTLLNPHVYLDTVLLMGTIGAQVPAPSRYLFVVGAVTASALWFFSLSFSGQLLAPLFRRPWAWRVLDTVVGATMWSIAASLAF